MGSNLRRIKYLPWRYLGAAAVLGAATAAHSQAAPTQERVVAPVGEQDEQEIIVTARKRGESLMTVPVTVTAVTAATLERRGVTNLESFARTIPNFFIANSSGAFQGAAVGLRGIGSSDVNIFGDQAVAFNIDGIQIARSTPKRLSNFDLEQIEVLKGPQALFYGKNSPGGIVVIHTANPTKSFEAGASGQYEFNGQEFRGEGFVSGPLTDTLGARLAVAGSYMGGYSINVSPLGTPYSPTHVRTPQEDEIGARLTLQYEGAALKARLKVNYNRVSNDGTSNNTQLISCPAGRGQFTPADNCKADNIVDHTSAGPVFGSQFDVYGDGQPYSTTRQILVGLELNYDLGSQLSLTSNSGYYDGDIRILDNLNQASSALSAVLFYTYAGIKYHEFSQELRLTSDFAGPLNFMVGGYYQNQRASYAAAAAFNAITPAQLYQPILLKQEGNPYSLFGNVSFKPLPTVEISGGARYSHEKKSIAYYRIYSGTIGGVPFAAGQRVPTTVPERSFSNVSPEVTVTWRPTSELTAYAGWKRGFLSGGFNGTGTGTSVALIGNQSYDQEIVEGFEGGIKGDLFDRTLRFSFAAYSYNIIGLQVGATLPGPPTINFVGNAATAYSRGVEGDFSLRTPIDGLVIRGAVAYNDARYKSFPTSPCYGGQTIAQGCSLGFNGTANTNQDLSGAPLVRSPKWAESLGATYSLNLSDGSNLTLSGDATWTSGFFTDAVNSPNGYQRAYSLIDASARYELRNGFSIALIGRNLTNEYYFQRSTGVPLGGTRAGLAVGTPPDQAAYVSRGREIAVKLSYRFK